MRKTTNLNLSKPDDSAYGGVSMTDVAAAVVSIFNNLD